MTTRWLKYFVLALSIAQLGSAVKAQQHHKPARSGTQTGVEAYFMLPPKINGSPDSVLFNPLIIKNHSKTNATVNIKMTTPPGWGVMDFEKDFLPVSKGDSIIVPISLLIPKKVKGDVGYVIVATIMTEEDHPLTAASFYVRVPGYSDLYYELPRGRQYLDPSTKTTGLTYHISNKGNVDELIILETTTPEAFQVEGEQNNRYITTISLPWKTDTTIRLPVSSDLPLEEIKYLEGVKLSIGTKEAKREHTLWIKTLNTHYSDPIPEQYKCLTAEFTAHDIFSLQNPNFSFDLTGNLLLKNNTDLYFSFHKYPYRQNFLEQTRFKVGAKNRYMNIYVGDVYHAMGKPMYAIGLNSKLFLGNKQQHQIHTIVSRNKRRPVWNSGISYKLESSKNISAEVGGIFSQAQDIERNSLIGFAGTSFKIGNNNVALRYAQSIDQSTSSPDDKRAGFGFNASYNGNFRRFRLNIRSYFGSPGYSGIYRGRFVTNASASYNINARNFLHLYYNNTEYNPKIYINDEPRQQSYTKNEISRIEYASLVTKKIEAFGGPVFLRQQSNAFYSQPDTILSSYAPQVRVGVRYRGGRSLFIQHYFTLGKQYITNAAHWFRGDYFSQVQKSYNTFNASTSVRTRNAGLFLNYYRGSYTPNETFMTLYYTDYETQQLNIMPYFRDFIYQDKLFFDARLNYNYNIASHSQRLYLMSSFRWFFGKGWSSYFSNNTSFSFYKDTKTGDKFSNTVSYAQIGVRKEFLCNQPRYRYGDLNIVFFKDLNANRQHDKNEPGIKNVKVKINREAFDVFGTPRGRLNTVELLSDLYGTVSYQNLPEGNYSLEITPLHNPMPFRLATSKVKFFLMHNKRYTEYILQPTEADSLNYLPSGRKKTNEQYDFLPHGKTDSVRIRRKSDGKEQYVPYATDSVPILIVENKKDSLIAFRKNSPDYKFVCPGKDTLYIPFFETFKLVGKIVLHRNPFSTHEPPSLENIRITAISEGEIHKETTFTDKNGNFIMYLPAAGAYSVSMRNIFSDNYVVQQDHFTVAFNGYKQFDVAFVVSEKASPPIIPDDFSTVQIVNFVGKVKDAQGFKSIDAKITVIKKEGAREVEVATAKAGKRDGDFSIEFIYDHKAEYIIIVEKQGYTTEQKKLNITQVSSIQTIEETIILSRESRKGKTDEKDH